jgi:hypothetical protein
MDLVNLGFIGIMVIGLTNILTFFLPNLDSKIKIGVSFVFAFALTFVPVGTASYLLDHIKLALEATAALSGTYKLAQKIGGK